jgi:hypothetical protein
MRRLLLAAGAALSLIGGGARAASVTDFVGPDDADLDVTFFSVSYDAGEEAFRLRATMAGAIDPSRFGLYAIGVNTGTGTNAPFANVGNPDVVFNQVIAVFKTGAVSVGGNPLTANISGASLSLVVPLSLLPTTGFQPARYAFNIWPRNGGDPSDNFQISDFAPDNATLAAAPEPAAWAAMLLGFGVLGGVLRARRRPAAAPALA